MLHALPSNLRHLLQCMRELLAAGGSTRFLNARLIRANSVDFPDPWQPTVANAYNLIYRLLWHSFIDVAVVITDERKVAGYGTQVLSDSILQFIGRRPQDGALEFSVTALGNDDVAGLASHEIGAAYLAMRNVGSAFRAEAREPNELESTLAAYLLGLGILAANSASYVRKHAELVGNSEYSEHKIAAHGALTVDEACFVLVVQDLVRDEQQSEAFATLRGPQHAAVDFWRAELLPYRRELRDALGLPATSLGDVATSLARPSQSRTAPLGLIEPDPRQFNRGRRTFRVAFHRGAPRMVGGWLVGAAVGGIVVHQAAVVWPLVGLVALGGGVGWVWGRRRKYWHCADPEVPAS